MSEGNQTLYLKWGTIKGWKGFAEGSEARAALDAYVDISGMSMSAMTQDNTDEHKLALCKIIDAVDGEIWNDWSGELMTKEAAKTYVMEYSK